MQWDARDQRARLRLARKDGSEPVPVAYSGILPDMFAEGARWWSRAATRTAALAARQIMTSCPSKYEAEQRAGRRRTGVLTMPELGRLAVCLALLFALYAVGAAIAGALRRRADARALRRARRVRRLRAGAWSPPPSCCARSSRTTSASSTSPPTRRARCRRSYTVAALWGGQKGSLLFWAFILTIFATRRAVAEPRANRELMPWVTATLMTRRRSSSRSCVFITDPFERLPHARRRGRAT